MIRTNMRPTPEDSRDRSQYEIDLMAKAEQAKTREEAQRILAEALLDNLTQNH